MLDRLKNIIVCALFGALCFFYAQQIWLASHPPRNDEIREAHYSKVKKDETNGPYRWKWGESDPALSFFTFCLGFVAAVQAGLFLWQLKYMGKGLVAAEVAATAAGDAVNAQRDEFAATHRAKIRIKHLWITSDISQTTPITVKMVCVNTGTTDATLKEIGIQCHVFGNEYLLPADPNIKASLYPVGILQPGYNWTIPNTEPNSFIDTGYILPPHEWRDIQRRHAKLYCVGWISYTDNAGRLRITGFCRVLEAPKVHAVVTTDNGRFRVCKHPDYEYQD